MEYYESLTDSIFYPLPFYSTRWVERKYTAHREIQIWENNKKLKQSWIKLRNSRQQKLKYYTLVKRTFYDTFMTAKF